MVFWANAHTLAVAGLCESVWLVVLALAAAATRHEWIIDGGRRAIALFILFFYFFFYFALIESHGMNQAQIQQETQMRLTRHTFEKHLRATDRTKKKISIHVVIYRVIFMTLWEVETQSANGEHRRKKKYNGGNNNTSKITNVEWFDRFDMLLVCLHDKAVVAILTFTQIKRELYARLHYGNSAATAAAAARHGIGHSSSALLTQTHMNSRRFSNENRIHFFYWFHLDSLRILSSNSNRSIWMILLSFSVIS